MTREEIKELLPIMQAWAEGKDIQIRNITDDGWDDINDDRMSFCAKAEAYRIKPEPKCRPFETQEECWNEMLKHQPFGWVKSKKSGSHFSIGSVLWDKEFDDVFVTFACDGMLGRSSKSMFEDFTFADGTPFGIKEE